LQGRTGGRSVVFSGQLYSVVVASCWSSSGDVELRMLLLPHTRTHLQHKKKKKKFCTYHSNGWRNEAVRYIMVLEPGFDPGTCGLWAHHASAAPKLVPHPFGVLKPHPYTSNNTIISHPNNSIHRPYTIVYLPMQQYIAYQIHMCYMFTI
jgi:hypothetical protein